MSLNQFKDQIQTLIMIVVVISAIALALDAYQNDMSASEACVNTSHHYNTTARRCQPLTNDTTAQATTVAFNATDEGLIGTGNASTYISTIGTLLGVAALIMVVMGAFYFISSRRE